MSFLVPCPTCGPRDVNEFTCTGEVLTRPTGDPSLRELMLVPTGTTPRLIEPFTLERFYTDTLVSELAAAAVSH